MMHMQPLPQHRSNTRTFTPDEIRRILLELRYIYTVRQICAKWHITPYRLRQWQHQWNYAYLSGSVRELIIAALHQGAQTTADINAYLDYVDRTVYTPEEIEAVLKQLEIDGFAIRTGTGCRYNPAHSQNDQAFIF